MKQPRNPLRIEVPLLAWLVIIWGALWQDFSPGNLLFGAIIALIVTRLFYLPPVGLSGRFNVLHAVRYAFVFVWHVAVASFELLWLALAKGPRVRSAVVAVPLRSHTDLMVTATGHVTSLVPGSMVVDVDRANATLYVHFINVEDAAGAERVRREVLDVEAELIRIMGAKEELTLVNEEHHLERMMSAERGEGGTR